MATKKYLDLDGLGVFKNKIASEIPTKTSDLTNDSGYISSETDPTVPSWAKQSTKPSYEASEIEYTNEEYYTHLTYGDDFTSVESTKDFADLLLLELDYDIDGIQTQLNGKQAKLYSGTNIKTINNTSILGSGNISISSGSEIIIETITSTVSVSANTTAQTTVNTSKTGYVFLGVVGLGASDNAIGFIQWRIFSTSVILVCRNFTNSAKNNITITIKALYMKE